MLIRPPIGFSVQLPLMFLGMCASDGVGGWIVQTTITRQDDLLKSWVLLDDAVWRSVQLESLTSKNMTYMCVCVCVRNILNLSLFLCVRFLTSKVWKGTLITSQQLQRPDPRSSLTPSLAYFPSPCGSGETERVSVSFCHRLSGALLAYTWLAFKSLTNFKAATVE